MSENNEINKQPEQFNQIQKGGEFQQSPKLQICKNCGRETLNKDKVCLVCKNK